VSSPPPSRCEPWRALSFLTLPLCGPSLLVLSICLSALEGLSPSRIRKGAAVVWGHPRKRALTRSLSRIEARTPCPADPLFPQDPSNYSFCPPIHCGSPPIPPTITPPVAATSFFLYYKSTAVPSQFFALIRATPTPEWLGLCRFSRRTCPSPMESLRSLNRFLPCCPEVDRCPRDRVGSQGPGIALFRARLGRPPLLACFLARRQPPSFPFRLYSA